MSTRTFTLLTSLLLLAGCNTPSPHSFSVDSTQYTLSSCHRLGAPQQVTLHQGKLSYGEQQSDGSHEIELAITQRLSGQLAGTSDTFTLVELSCQLWGANYTTYEWPIFTADGQLLAKIDEESLQHLYASIAPDEALWFSNALPDNVGPRLSVQGSKLQLTFAAGGAHAAPKELITFQYQVTPTGLKHLAPPVQHRYPALSAE